MFFERFFNPQLDWIQIEISTHCNAACIYCPHTIYRHHWRNHYLPMEAFRNLEPALRNAKLIYLQGWGEPLTHPRFFEMLKLAKATGRKVGTTTNGTLLDDQKAEKLVTAHLDVIGFSLAGIDAKNDAIRQGTRIKSILEGIEKIHRAKQKYGSDKPAIHIAYMLLRSGIEDLEKLPKFLSATGAAQTVISSLSFVASPEMQTEAALATKPEEYSELKGRFTQVRDESAALGSEVCFYIVSPGKNHFSCSENVPGAAVIGANRDVSPCFMKQIPVRGKNYFFVGGKQYRQQNLSFGNLRQASFNTIRHRKEYRQFIKEIRNGIAPAACQNCLKGQIDNLAIKSTTLPHLKL
jgi:MoaA/NifB/PqqE/SkfB family radical SAM enzyme